MNISHKNHVVCSVQESADTCRTFYEFVRDFILLSGMSINLSILKISYPHNKLFTSTPHSLHVECWYVSTLNSMLSKQWTLTLNKIYELNALLYESVAYDEKISSTKTTVCAFEIKGLKSV